MLKLIYFCIDIVLIMFIGRENHRNSFHNRHSESRYLRNFRWIIRYEFYFFYSEILKYFSYHRVFASIWFMSESYIGIIGIISLFLQFICLDFFIQPNPSSLLTMIDKHTISRSFDHPKRSFFLWSTVTLIASKYISRKTFTMDSYKYRFRNIEAFCCKDNSFFSLITWIHMDDKISEFCWKICLNTIHNFYIIFIIVMYKYTFAT